MISIYILFFLKKKYSCTLLEPISIFLWSIVNTVLYNQCIKTNVLRICLAVQQKNEKKKQNYTL